MKREDLEDLVGESMEDMGLVETEKAHKEQGRSVYVIPILKEKDIDGFPTVPASTNMPEHCSIPSVFPRVPVPRPSTPALTKLNDALCEEAESNIIIYEERNPK